MSQSTYVQRKRAIQRREQAEAPHTVSRHRMHRRASIDSWSASLSATPAQMGALDRALVQFRAAVDARGGHDDIHARAQAGVSGSGGTLPHFDTIQKAFGGHDVSGIEAHVGGQATVACESMNAEAYATSGKVAFKSAPSLHTAAHEAAHVIQQRAGVALKGGVGQVGDAYEQHADAVADGVVAGKNVESLLGPIGAGGLSGAVQHYKGPGSNTPAADPKLAVRETNRGAVLDQHENKDRTTGYHAVKGSMAKDPDFEKNAQTFEDRLGKRAVKDPVARAAAAVLSKEVETIVEKWATTLADAGVRAEELQQQVSSQLEELTGSDEHKVAGAVGKQAEQIRAALKKGNLREQMTILFNFGMSFGTALRDAPDGKVDAFIETLDVRATGLKQRAQRLATGTAGGRLVSDSKTGEVGGQANTRGLAPGRDADLSERTVGQAEQQGVELSDREVATMELNREELATRVLKWSEGNRKWLINEGNAWVQKTRDANLPIKAGPSGTTDRIMQLREMLGVSSPISTRAACIGYLLPINAHSLIEILEAASQYSCPKPTYGPSVYAEIEPFQGLEALAPTSAFWKMVKGE